MNFDLRSEWQKCPRSMTDLMNKKNVHAAMSWMHRKVWCVATYWANEIKITKSMQTSHHIGIIIEHNWWVNDTNTSLIREEKVGKHFRNLFFFLLRKCLLGMFVHWIVCMDQTVHCHKKTRTFLLIHFLLHIPHSIFSWPLLVLSIAVHCLYNVHTFISLGFVRSFIVYALDGRRELKGEREMARDEKKSSYISIVNCKTWIWRSDSKVWHTKFEKKWIISSFNFT